MALPRGFVCGWTPSRLPGQAIESSCSGLHDQVWLITPHLSWLIAGSLGRSLSVKSSERDEWVLPVAIGSDKGAPPSWNRKGFIRGFRGSCRPIDRLEHCVSSAP